MVSREIIDFEQVSVETLAESDFTAPVRLVLPNPLRGGPSLASVRAALAPKGQVRISATTARLFVDLDPGPSEPSLIALDTIVRSDAAGLERMLHTVLPHVDEIVLGVDGRSDEETLRVAQAYGDCVFVFEAADIGLSTEEWTPSETNPRGKINFAAARNLGRSRVRSPFALVIDSDEYLLRTEDLRARIKIADESVDGFTIVVQMGTFEHRDFQRLVRTKYRWTAATHNQLIYTNKPLDADAVVVCDTSLRDAEEQSKRMAQREVGIGDLLEEAAKGNITALFHLAKHRGGGDDIAEAVRLTEDYRLRIEPHSPLADERAWLALSLAFRFFNEDNLDEADRWAVRALLDGPRVAAFCLLGDIAESQGDLLRAQGWYECACSVSNDGARIEWPGFTELRFGRLAGIKRALESGVADKIELVEDLGTNELPSSAPTGVSLGAAPADQDRLPGE